MSLYRGDVVLIRVAFHQVAGSKIRPAVVVFDGNDDDFVAVPITSRPGRSTFDIVLTDWSAGGPKRAVLRADSQAGDTSQDRCA